MPPAWMLTVAMIGAAPSERPAVAPLPVERKEPSSRRSSNSAAAVDDASRHDASAADLRRPLAELSKLDGDDLAEECERAVRESAKRARPDPTEMVPRLVELYGRLNETTELGRSEATRLQSRIEFRLQQLQRTLKSTIARAERTAARSSQPVRSRPSEEKSFAAPRDVANARALIDLIQSTVAPESWEINGGHGSIRYYAPLKVLVIRQTTETHYQLRGTLKQLRK